MSTQVSVFGPLASKLDQLVLYDALQVVGTGDTRDTIMEAAELNQNEWFGQLKP